MAGLPSYEQQKKNEILGALKLLDGDVYKWFTGHNRGRIDVVESKLFQNSLDPSLDETTKQFVMRVENDVDVFDAANSIISAARQTSFFTPWYGENSSQQGFKAWGMALDKICYQDRQNAALEAGAGYAKMLSEMYIQGLLSFSPGAEAVVEVGEIIDKGFSWTNLLSILPFVPKIAQVAGKSAGIGMRFGKNVLNASQEVIEKFGLLSKAKQREIFESVAKIADPKKAAAQFNDLLKILPNPNGDMLCFTHGTPVRLETSTKPIEQVQPGEYVKVFDFQSDSWCHAQVLKRIDNCYSGPLISLKLANETIRVTPHHPVWVVTGCDLESRAKPHELPTASEFGTTPGRWVDSHDLLPGDVLKSASGFVTVESVDLDVVEDLPVCNLTVEGIHNYVVGAAEFLVHNTSWCDYIIKEGGDKMKALHAQMKKQFGNVHGHHIVMKGDFCGPTQQGIKKWNDKSQQLLLDNNFDILFGLDNLTFAKNADHSAAYAESVFKKLQYEIKKAGAGNEKAGIKIALSKIAEVLNQGEKYRFDPLNP